MSYYEKNIECIKNNHDYFYNELNKNCNSPININKLDNIQSSNAKDGEKIVLMIYKSIEYRLNSIYRPIEEAKKWAEQFKFQNVNTVVSMFGLGNGLFARAILDKMGDNDCLLIYEPCYDVFNHVLNNYNITDILSNKRVLIAVEGINDFDFHKTLQSVVNITNLKSQIQCIYPNYDIIFTESCIRFFKELKDTFTSAKVNINTTIFMAEKYIDNTIKNMKFIKNSYSLLELKKYMPGGYPAIVVAAGPSVEENIEELKKAKGKAVIFAVDRILDYLLASGVEPDFVVTLDPMKGIKYFSERENIKIPLICLAEASPEILMHHKGKKIFCTSNSFIEEIYMKTNKMPPRMLTSGSVALVAYSACVILGFKRVILVGQDLAYNGDISHAGGVVNDRGENANVFVEGLDGKQIKSRYDWKEFVIRYQDLITMNQEVEVIDAKQKGAKIKGTIVMPLKDAVSKYCINTFEIETILGKMEATFQSADLDVIEEFFVSNLNIMKKIKEKAEKATKECDNLIKYYDEDLVSHKTEEALKKISKINKYINEQKIYSFMDSYITAKTAHYLSEILLFTDNNSKNSITTYKTSKAIYQAVIDAADFVKIRIENAINELS